MSDDVANVLPQTVAKIRKKILRLRDRGERIGEQDTKSALIDPILRALGWNIDDLEDVRSEYRRKSKDNPVDYALFLLRKECLFIEAKALEKNISDRRWILQTLSYATAVGVEWCVLTNGDEYRLYNSLAPVPADEKLFRSFKISDSAKDGFAIETLGLMSKEKMGERILNVLWRAHFIDGHVKKALRDLLSPRNASIVRLIQKTTQGIGPKEIRESLKRADIQIDFPVMPVDGKRVPRKKGTARSASTSTTPTLVDLIKAGRIMPPFALEAEYKGRKFTASIQADGTVLFAGTAYNSLSTAAGMARATVTKQPPGRKYPQTNGWTFWKFRDPETGRLCSTDVLRKRL